MSENIFSEFEAPGKDAWKTQAEKEIKRSVSEITSIKPGTDKSVKPYLTLEDLDPLQLDEIQNCQKKTPGWLNIPIIESDSPWVANSKIQSAIAGGAEGVLLRTDTQDIPTWELPKVLHGIRLSDIPVYFATSKNPEILFDTIAKGAGYYLRGGIMNDPIANWMRNAQPFEAFVPRIAGLIKKTKNMKEFRPLMVESHVFHNAGATAVQELAFLLGTLVTYMDMLTDHGIPPLQALSGIFLSVSIGPEYLTEIAKLRALRLIYCKIGMAYQVPVDLSQPYIHTITSSFYSTIMLPHNNIIRATSEAMSAVAGGCNALTIQPFDHKLTKINDLSDQIARNISLLIANESYLNQVADPSAGSYFIENLSLEMADAAWTQFLKTEQEGGIVKCFENGRIQNEIEKSWSDKREAIQTDRIIVGVNKYNHAASHSKSFDTSTSVGSTDKSKQLKLLPERNLADSWLRQ